MLLHLHGSYLLKRQLSALGQGGGSRTVLGHAVRHQSAKLVKLYLSSLVQVHRRHHVGHSLCCHLDVFQVVSPLLDQKLSSTVEPTPYLHTKHAKRTPELHQRQGTGGILVQQLEAVPNFVCLLGCELAHGEWTAMNSEPTPCGGVKQHLLGSRRAISGLDFVDLQ